MDVSLLSARRQTADVRTQQVVVNKQDTNPHRSHKLDDQRPTFDSVSVKPPQNYYRRGTTPSGFFVRRLACRPFCHRRINLRALLGFKLVDYHRVTQVALNTIPTLYQLPSPQLYTARKHTRSDAAKLSYNRNTFPPMSQSHAATGARSNR